LLSFQLFALAFALACVPSLWAQASKSQARPVKLLSPDRIVADHLKAVGGKKRQQAVRDAAYEWRAEGAGGGGASLRVFRKAPASTRSDSVGPAGETTVAANARTAWARSLDGALRTLTDREATSVKLQSALSAARLVDLKKQDVLSRTVALEEVGGEPAYAVEFSRRNGARVRYWFGARTKLLLRVRDDERRQTITFSDYRPTPDGPVEPHRLEIRTDGGDALAFTLRGARYNTNLPDSLFEPPGDESLNVAELLREVERNQRELDERVSEYTFTRRQTEREFNDRGELKKEKTFEHEIYPVAGGGRVLKLVSENGVALAGERLAREERRVAGEIEKLERENERRRQKREAAARRRGETGAGEDGDGEGLGVAAFLRACEFVSPRRESFRGRDAVVFDFRPRPGFKPAGREESIVGKLSGAIWVDPEDRQVMRLEARLDEGFKVGGGLFASVKPGSAVVVEQARVADGVWLPKFSQISAAAKLFLFAGVRIDATREYGNYKRFTTKTGDAKVDAPPAKPER
jgi:outer membrane lipoprotein-sorting protein